MSSGREGEPAPTAVYQREEGSVCAQQCVCVCMGECAYVCLCSGMHACVCVKMHECENEKVDLRKFMKV